MNYSDEDLKKVENRLDTIMPGDWRAQSMGFAIRKSDNTMLLTIHVRGMEPCPVGQKGYDAADIALRTANTMVNCRAIIQALIDDVREARTKR